jgi:O-antigen/teichoic acid export membrane protein
MRLQHLTRILRADLRSDTERGKLMHAAGITATQKICATLLVFAASLVYARALGPHGYGLYAYVIAWCTILAIPVALGLPQYLVREGAKAPDSLPVLRRWADARILASGSVAMVLLGSAAFIPHAAGARWLFVIGAPLPLLMSIGAVRGALLQARGHVARSQWPRLLLAPTLTLATFVGLWLWRGELYPIDLMVATIAATLLSLLINSLQLRRIAPESSREYLIKMRLRDALPFIWVAGLFLLNSRIDLIMLGSLKGAYDAGVYAVASRAAELTSFLMVAGNMVLAPKISRLYHSGEHALLRRMVRGATRRILIASIPLALILVIAAQPLLTHLYGQQYAEGAAVLQILAIAQILTVASGPLGTLLNMTGHEKVNTKNMIVAVALNIVLNALLIPTYGASGAASATGVSLVFSRILLWSSVRRHLRLRSAGLNSESR